VEHTSPPIELQVANFAGRHRNSFHFAARSVITLSRVTRPFICTPNGCRTTKIAEGIILSSFLDTRISSNHYGFGEIYQYTRSEKRVLKIVIHSPIYAFRIGSKTPIGGYFWELLRLVWRIREAIRSERKSPKKLYNNITISELYDAVSKNTNTAEVLSKKNDQAYLSGVKVQPQSLEYL
jgi:hypothetical protein